MKPITLALTLRHAMMLRTLCNNERKRRKRAYGRSDYMPDPGRHDSNLMRVKVMEEIISELDPQIAAENQRHKESTP